MSRPSLKSRRVRRPDRLKLFQVVRSGEVMWRTLTRSAAQAYASTANHFGGERARVETVTAEIVGKAARR